MTMTIRTLTIIAAALALTACSAFKTEIGRAHV